MKWVTRERPVIDRIACPWLIARFIDKEPEFLFVPPDRVIPVAQETGATPYDVPGVEFTHVGDGCSFDTFVSKYGLERDPAIVTIASIVRGADTDRHDLTPQSAGLLAISMGLRDLTPDDQEVLKHGFVIYDALYAWASRRKAETHSWPPAMKPTAAA
ncbi:MULTISPECIES: chromate resistance protein ChrB domain-containing protein [unclassified Mesorhizobium]|uniref:chromate resistance protein ChrB domain-containing protein n=1 Tax=unclassified Mesorhizobium TaxID=325217 RepID=UPI003337B091